MNAAWADLVQKYELSESCVIKLQIYLDWLIAWNNKFNLTAITNESEIINYHFNDSLSVSQLFNINDLQMIADVGAGAGFPGLPLKIVYPHLKLILIEVNGKKVEFLKSLVAELGLINVQIEQLDWRTFLRQGEYKVDLFCARASLQVEELVRIFKPGCVYKEAKLVYWAAKDWQPSAKVRDLISETFNYSVGERKRKLVLLQQKLS